MSAFEVKEEILYKSVPDSKTLLMWIFSKGLFFIAIYFLCFGWIPIFLWYMKIQIPTEFVFLDILAFFIILVLISLYQIPLVKSHSYVITNQNIIVKAGVLSKRERIISFDKITNLTVSQGLFEQMFSLFRLRIQTAVEFGEVSFIGLSDIKTPKDIISQHMKRN
ncbi:MAG: PH domain-containing protein [archaeon]|jgi:uncharacterized membrane protein YdbT with pleckstrin-like domain